MSFGEGNLRERVDELKKLNGELCAEVNRKDALIRKLEAEIAERSEAHEANIGAVIKEHAEMNRFTKAQMAETEHVNGMLRKRIHILESLVRDMASGEAWEDMRIGQRMAELGLLGDDAR